MLRFEICRKVQVCIGTLHQAELPTVNASDIHTRARTRLLTEWQKRLSDSEMGRYCYSIVPSVSIEAWMASAVDERVFLVAMSRLASNHTSTRAHLLKINVVQDVLCQCAMGYDTNDHGLHCTLRKELHITPGAISSGRNMVALRLIFKYA
jgi:hypothetical protein